MPDSPERIRQAQEHVKGLVKKGNYDGAIALLKTLDHPKKQQWIDLVKSRQSDQAFEQSLHVPSPAPVPPPVIVKKQPGCVQRVRFVISSVLLVFVGLTVWAIASTYSVRWWMKRRRMDSPSILSP